MVTPCLSDGKVRSTYYKPFTFPKTILDTGHKVLSSIEAILQRFSSRFGSVHEMSRSFALLLLLLNSSSAAAFSPRPVPAQLRGRAAIAVRY
jgi:hypothetical protein